MSIRDQLLHKQLQKHRQNRSATDLHETPAPYKHWLPGLRSLLRLRYLKIKNAVLIENKQSLRYDVSTAEYTIGFKANSNQKPGYGRPC